MHALDILAVLIEAAESGAGAATELGPVKVHVGPQPVETGGKILRDELVVFLPFCLVHIIAIGPMYGGSHGFYASISLAQNH